MLGHSLLGRRAGLELIIHFSASIFILFVTVILSPIRLALVNLGEKGQGGWWAPPRDRRETIFLFKERASPRESGPNEVRSQQARAPSGAAH